MDLDALLVKSNIESTLKLVKEKAESDLNDGVWFRFESQVDLATQGEVLKNLQKAQIVHFDLGIGDPITPAPQQEKTSSLLSEN